MSLEFDGIGKFISHLFLAADLGLDSSRIQFSGCLSFDFSADQSCVMSCENFFVVHKSFFAV